MSRILSLFPRRWIRDLFESFQATSLYNVVAKIIAKVMENCLKHCLYIIIDPEQSVFVPGGIITNNIMVEFEYLHVIQRKFDMNKAYDLVEWKGCHASYGIIFSIGWTNNWLFAQHSLFNSYQWMSIWKFLAFKRAK